MTDRRPLVEDYVRRGWIPFAYSGQFTPPVGWQRSTIEPDTVDKIVNSKTPIGLLMGKVSNVVCVDIDGRNGGSAQKFLDHYGLKPQYTRVHASASPGSFHILFQFPEELDALQKTKGERTGIPALTGVDLLADGAHILAPPTVRTGHPEKPDGQYRLQVDVPVNVMPPALLVDWLSAASRSNPEGKPVSMVNPEEYDRMLWLHKRNIEIAADAKPGTRDDVCTARIGASVRLALAMHDSVLSAEKVYEDFLAGVPYEIKDLDGKVKRAVEWAEKHAWQELSEPEGDLPDGIPASRASEYWDQVTRIRIGKAAKRKVDLEEQEREMAYVEVGPIRKGAEFMASTPTAPEWIVEDLIHHAGSALLAGKYKSGKSTLMLNLIKSLTTGTPFLGKFAVGKPMTVAYVDMELGERLAWKWLKEIPGVDYSKLVYVPRVGQGKQLNMRSDTVRANTARMLRENDVDVMILDPLSPVMSALGMDENGSESVRPLLDSFDMLKVEAELQAIVVSHHTGHQDQSRARGSSAFMDWPSSYFSVVRNGDEYDSPRYFQATGRDVQVSPANLLFDLDTRSLRLEDPLAEFGLDKKEEPW